MQEPHETTQTCYQSCAICAWRETCAKKFTVSGRDIRCAEYTRDLAIKDEPEHPDKTRSPKP